MKKLLLSLSILTTLLGYGQNDDIDLELFAERLFQIQDEDIEYEDIYESLLLFYSNKLNLNKVEPDELASLYILSPSQLSNFFAYRDQFGNLLSLNELQAVPELDLETIRLLRPFVTVKESVLDNRPLVKRIIEEENNYLLLRFTRRLEEQRGYTEAPFDTTFVRDGDNNVSDTNKRSIKRS
ncbi:MAG: helix-hairpin-helix domain-containing protein, partial [Bacteroidota bacterium]